MVDFSVSGTALLRESSSPVPQHLESWGRRKCREAALRAAESIAASLTLEPNVMPCPKDMLLGVTRTPLKSPLLRTNVFLRNRLARASAGRRPGAPVLSLRPNHSPQGALPKDIILSGLFP